MRPEIYEALSAVWSVHKNLKTPAELGRVMSVAKKDKKKPKKISKY